MAPLPRSVAELTQLGLTTYEAKAYVALLGRDSFTAAQVSRQAGLPRQRIYDVLGSLVEKGLASSRPHLRRRATGCKPTPRTRNSSDR